MLRPGRFVSVFKQIKQLQNIQCQISTRPRGCRFSFTVEYSSQLSQHRHQSTAAEPAAAAEPSEEEPEEPIPPPHVEGQEKTYSPKVQAIVDEISNLTLLEVADLNECLKKTLKITSTPMMAAGPMPVAAAAPDADEETEQKPQRVSYTVKLVKFDASKKVALIKQIKSELTDMNLVQAKKFVESAPTIVKSDLMKEEAEKLKETLTAVGAEIAIE